ncbi:MAG: hypothetical protein KAQ75_05545, partial [Bacteroidales bacterium]|nr:hypothetical protein [Bacteroidales bacterium]
LNDLILFNVGKISFSVAETINMFMLITTFVSSNILLLYQNCCLFIRAKSTSTMIYVTRRERFSAAHRLFRDEWDDKKKHGDF